MALTPEQEDQLNRARALNDRARKRQLAGDPQAKRDFDSRWAPLQDWLRENRGE